MAIPSRTLGIIEILVSGVAFGFLGVFGKWAYASGLTPGELLSLRFLLAAGVTACGIGLLRPSLFRVSLKTVLSCAALGILGYAVFASCYFQALKGISASLTVLLLYTYPVIVTIGARVLFGEKLGTKGWVALPLSTVGLGLLVWGDIAVNDRTALLYGFGSALFYSIYILASSHLLMGVSPYVSAMLIQLAAGLVLGAINLHEPARVAMILKSGWQPVLGTALISTVAAMTLFLSGLKKLKKAEVSILSTGEPVTAIIAAALILGERLAPLQMAGAGLVMAALVLIALRDRVT